MSKPDLKKAPAVEFMVPKRVFLKQHAESDRTDSLLVKLADFE